MLVDCLWSLHCQGSRRRMLKRDSIMTCHILGLICCISSGFIYSFTFVDCIPVPIISHFCEGNHSLTDQTSESWMLPSPFQLGPEIEIRFLVHSTTITVVENSATVFNIIRPANHTSFLVTLKEMSGHFSHDENFVAMEPEPTVTLICSPVSHPDISPFLIHNLPSLAIPLDREVYLVHLEQENSTTSVVLTEIYTIQDVTVHKRIPSSGSTALYESFNQNELLRIAYRRSNLQGLAVKVVVQVEKSYPDAVKISTSENGTISFASGYNIFASRDLQIMLNFTYIPVVGSGWIKCKNSGLIGMGAQLMDYEADIIASVSSFLLCRMEKLYFLPAMSYEEGYVFYRDDAAAPSHTDMLEPFSKKLWMAIFLAWSILWIIYTIFFMITPKELVIGLDVSPCFIFSSVTCQGHAGSPPDATSQRMILVASAVTGYLICCIYNAQVIACLSAPSTYIHNLDDLPYHGYITYTAPHTYRFATNLFSNEKYQKTLMENTQLHYRNFDQGVSSVFDDTKKYAFLCTPDDFYATGLKLQIKEDTLCGVSSMKNLNSGRVKLGMVLRKGSPLRELFTQKTMKIIETGLSYRYRLILTKHARPVCDSHRNRRPGVAITIRQCASAFTVVLMGLVLATFVLILEKLVARFRPLTLCSWVPQIIYPADFPWRNRITPVTSFVAEIDFVSNVQGLV